VKVKTSPHRSQILPRPLLPGLLRHGVHGEGDDVVEEDDAPDHREHDVQQHHLRGQGVDGAAEKSVGIHEAAILNKDTKLFSSYGPRLVQHDAADTR
jgi:hypothetical protein